MRVISIKEPYATLISEGYKKYEFRTWKTKYRGEILIHASKTIDKKAMERFKYLNLTYSPGNIIAKANITDCIYVEEEFKKEYLSKDAKVYKNLNTFEGYGFKIEDVEKIEKKEVKGQLGLWNLDIEL